MKLKIDEKKLTELFGFDEIRNIAGAIIARAEGYAEESPEGAYDLIIDALNDELLYTSDQWEVMKAYQLPEDANFNNALREFINDLTECVEVLEDDE